MYSNLRRATLRQLELETMSYQSKDAPLQSTSAHVPLAGDRQERVPSAKSMKERNGSESSLFRARKAETPSIHASAPAPAQAPRSDFPASRNDTPISTLDLDALDRLNEERLKRLTAMETSSRQRSQAKGSKKTDDVLENFMQAERNRQASANALAADSILNLYE